MLNRYSLWKYLLIVVIVALGAVYALPNLYGSDPAIQISATRTTTVDSSTQARVINLLDGDRILYRRVVLGEKGLLIRFNNIGDQLKAQELVSRMLGSNYNVAINLAPSTPTWLDAVNALPMYLGLDLRGGLHFLMEVDSDTVIRQEYEAYNNDLRTALRKADVRYLSVRQEGEWLTLKFRSAELRDKAYDVVRREVDTRKVLLTEADAADSFLIKLQLTEATLIELQRDTVKQNIVTLRNRVNEIGVSEPVIQQQGDNRIVVQLPGIQDSARAKDILSATATLEFRLVDVDHNARDAVNGRTPLGTKLYYDRDGAPVLLKKRVIVTGDQINSASSGIDQESGTPAVYVNLSSAGAKKMGETTKKNLKKPMAVVFIERKIDRKTVNGEEIKVPRLVEEVINVATIQGVFSKQFQITGLDNIEEARRLSLLLRAGALRAPIDIVEERTIGPSMGQDNIDQGQRSVVIGLLLVMVFIAIWYRSFGLVANLALGLNIVLIVAVLSLFQATLTLPGIAGIVLTVGMAVDANVLIFERIREEIRLGNSPQSSIHAGYEKALSTIADANITTLIAAIVLYIFGTGPIKGFAITLSIGIVTSMFTAIMGTRAVINLAVGGRNIKKLSI